ncbi:MAG: hypothetical protein QOF70_2704 [Acetobacteraceae bacterium]|nr:hypothetical protein [Acetobacteraceae bacterium]
MRLTLIALLLPLLLAGCLSFSSSDPKPPESHATVAVPPPPPTERNPLRYATRPVGTPAAEVVTSRAPPGQSRVAAPILKLTRVNDAGGRIRYLPREAQSRLRSCVATRDKAIST